MHYIGLAADVTATLELISGMECGSTVNRQLMRKYESLLSNACNNYDKYNLTGDQLADLIIAGERFNLNTLLSSAIDLASKCVTFNSSRIRRYNEISVRCKLRIAQKIINLKETRPSSIDVYL